MTARQRAYSEVLTHFEAHVRAIAELSGLLIARLDKEVDRAAELASTATTCEATYKRLVYEEAMRRLGIRVGRRSRRKIAEATR